MCGIAGMIDLTGGRRLPPVEVLKAMADAIVHRGPDEDGFLERPGIGFANRRLSIVGLADGRQPISNEDGAISVVFNGEFFDYPERKADLERRGHTFHTHCDTELIPHFYEEQGEGMFESLRGQFAIALWDSRGQKVILARDRFGICPLYWTRQEGWLLFASEIKALLASGFVSPRPDPMGINQVFSFFAIPGPVTCFEGVQALLPGHFLRIQLAQGTRDTAEVTNHTYWEIDFPDAGHEDPGTNPKKVVDEFQEVLLGAVERRLRADVPVVSYLSGGVDSSVVVALASHVRGKAIPTFTIRVEEPQFNEESEALQVARHVGAQPVVVGFGRDEVLATYPQLIHAAEAPVIDTACAALLMLAKEVHRLGYKVALTGEGADEWLAGYPWYRVHKALGWLDVVPGLKLSQLARRSFLRYSGLPQFAWDYVRKVQEFVGGHNPWLDIYGLMSLSKLRFFSKDMLDRVVERIPYADLGLNLDRARRWHPLNRALYFGARIMLPGLLLSCKGDRVAMNSSVETRYPFLDEEVFSFLANLHPRWKLPGLREKYVLRLLADRWVPHSIAWRRKAMFRAPFDTFHLDPAPSFVDQLLSEESLRRTGYFDVAAVRHWRTAFQRLRPGWANRTSIEMGLMGVVGTQLWHHLFVDASLCELPSMLPTQRPKLAAS